jgi:hypothetical protein
LDAPEMLFSILNDQIVSLVSTVGSKNHVPKLQEPSNNCRFADVTNAIGISITFTE